MKSFLKLASIALLASQCLGQLGQTQTSQLNQNSQSNGMNQSVQGTATQADTNQSGLGQTGQANTSQTGQTTQTTGQTGQNISANAPLAPVFTECKKPGQFVLTFDDGPNINVPSTTKCLDVLKKNGIIGTFFINSNNYVQLDINEQARAVVKRAFDEGHDIGSHTYNHESLFKSLDEGTLELNVDKNNEVIKSIIGLTPIFIRPPEGNGGFTEEYCASHGIPYDPKTETVRKYLGERGMKVIMWNADTQDWNNQGNVQNSLTELAKSVRAPGASPQTNSFITLLHDVHEYSVDVILQETIDFIKKEGYQIVSLAECLGEAPYLEGYNKNTPASAPTPTAILNKNAGQSLGADTEFDLESSSIKIVASMASMVILAIINALLY